MIEMTTLSDREYRLFKDLVYEKIGISLGEQKRSLIAGRLSKVLRQSGFTSFEEYYDFVSEDASGQALTTLIDRISTNHTFFNRENDHFRYFIEFALPELVSNLKKQGDRKIRIWSAGCSSGEESYTLAMLLLEYLGKEAASWNMRILATDISHGALEKAVGGSYESENVAKLPAELRSKYLSKMSDGQWSVNDNVKSLILYRKLNLIRNDFPFKGKFQMIFCRNVMIYFDKPTRDALISRFYRYTEENGYLFIGHSETLGRENTFYRYVRPAIYRRDSLK